MTGQPLRLLPLEPEHWPDASAIYAQGIRTGDATFETRVPGWDEWDATHLHTGRIVALRDSEVVGWAALTPVSRRPVYSGVAEVSVYVAEAARGHGVGTELLNALIEAAETGGIWTLQASVFPENEATLRLHARCGFRQVGRRERIGRARGGWRDTLLLERRSARVGVD